MLQVAVSGGKIQLVDVPEPAIRPGGLLVRTCYSLVSAGTESAMVGGGGGDSLVLRALRNPRLVRKVVDYASNHGVKKTVDLVRTRVSTEQPIGYSCSGIVTEVAPDVAGFRSGDRVACCGTGYANHAACNFIPQNLAARIPEGVPFDEAAFGTLGAIALQGVRRCAPQLGDRIAVLGLGLLGQLTVQMLRASGAVVIGVDIRDDRVKRALELGMQSGFNSGSRDLIPAIMESTEGQGADAVIVTAAGKDASLLNRAFEACRKKGRVVLVGDVPIRIQRDRIYKKELDFFISTSYGPGRYDPDYEERGIDYPLAYVRWTEGRNLGEVLRLIKEKALVVRPLIDRVYPIEEASGAYDSLFSEVRPTAVLLDYHPHVETPPDRSSYAPSTSPRKAANRGMLGVGVIGYGSYFRTVLLPLLKAHSGFVLTSVCSRTGLTVRDAVENDGFVRGTTDLHELLADPEVEVVYVATRHDQHYPVARAAVESGKAVFVEKPMTMTAEEGRLLAHLVAERNALLTVGFNRRFSPHARHLKEILATYTSPKIMLYRVNAGQLPPDHWLMDAREGGGRLLGEGVHFFDFLCFLAGCEPVDVHAHGSGPASRDEAIISIRFSDGSIGSLIYTGAGSPASGKERVEVFCAGTSFILDDFRSLHVYGGGGKDLKTGKIEKGQKEQLRNFYSALRGEAELGVTADDGYRATLCAEKAVSSILQGR